MFQSEITSTTTFSTIILNLTSTGRRCQLNSGSDSNERIKIATMNVRSIKPKTAPFSEYLTSKNLDIVAVTETWLTMM